MCHYCEQYNTVYTTGEEKAKWVRKYTTAKVISYTIPKALTFTFKEVCNSVKSKKHRTTNCALLNAYRLASVLSSSFDGGGECGGGEGYKYESEPQTYHEYYSSLQRSNTSYTLEH